MLKWLRKIFNPKQKSSDDRPEIKKPDWLDRMIDESEAEVYKRYGNGKE